MTVATSTEDDEKEIKSSLADLPVVILEPPHSTIGLQTQQSQLVHIPIPPQQQQQLSHVSLHSNQPQLQQASVQTHSQVIKKIILFLIYNFEKYFYYKHILDDNYNRSCNDS